MKPFDVYVITGESLSKGRSDTEVVREAIAGGAKIIQFREKDWPREKLIEVGKQIKELCEENDVMFIVNDDSGIAAEVGADGVHLGQSDLEKHDLEYVRQDLGEDRSIIGISTHSVEQAIKAEELGADYIGVGPIFPTDTKPDAEQPVGVEMLKQIMSVVEIPCVPIGGISLDTVDQVAFAKHAAAISAIVGAEDIKTTVEEFRKRLR